MATSLAPLPSFLCFSLGLPLPALLLGLLIGLVIPPLSLHTLRLLRGMSLYNIGFACGLTAAVLANHAGRVWLDAKVSAEQYNALLSTAGWEDFAPRLVVKDGSASGGSWYR